MAFKRHKKADDRIKSATALIKIILANNNSGILKAHRKELLGTLIWKITERNGKHNTVYKSEKASKMRCDRSNSRHDHVFTLRELKNKLLDASSKDIDAILAEAIGCVVTPDEHA